MEWADHIYAHKFEEEREKLNQATSENASCEGNFQKADVNKNTDELLAHALHEQEREKVEEEKQKEEDEFQRLQV